MSRPEPEATAGLFDTHAHFEGTADGTGLFILGNPPYVLEVHCAGPDLVLLQLNGKEFYSPSGNGYEVRIKEHMKKLKGRD